MSELTREELANAEALECRFRGIKNKIAAQFPGGGTSDDVVTVALTKYDLAALLALIDDALLSLRKVAKQ